jgi:LuxR family transcriptional regulator, maltose regulon positive regulatory protein
MTADPLSSPLLRVKQSIPPVRPDAVLRSRLEDRLWSAATKLTLVVAPAGWGKTTLLSRWAASAAATDTRIAWVSLDRNDDEPVRFWSYVLTALDHASADISSAAQDLLAGSGDGPTAHALPALLNELAASSTNHVLVLDDLHVIAHPGVHESLEFLVAYLPQTLRIVIGSRADPPLPLARMRGRGELTEVRAEELRFSLEESAALLATVSNTELDPPAAAAVWERSEGWAAGLQLAGLSLRGSPVDGAATGIAADTRHLFDYFTEEVLPALAPLQRDLLVRTAPLEFLSGSLCDAALGVQGSAAVLAELDRADLFVVALDPEREWYRCHRLLRDALLRSPEAEAARAERDVLRRAAGWFEEHDRVDDAVRHLLSAGDIEHAQRLLSDRFHWFLGKGWAATYLALGGQLPQAAVRTRLAVALAYAGDLTGDPVAVVHWLDLAEAGIDETTVLPRWRSPLAGVLALRGVFGTPNSAPALAVELCERAVALETAAGNAEHPDAWTALGRAYGLAGRFEEGVRILDDMWHRRAGLEWSTERFLQVAGLLALFRLAMGHDVEDDDLDRLLLEAAPVAVEAEREWGAAAAAAAVTLLRLVDGRRSFERGDLVGAAEQLAAGLTLAELAARPTYVVIGLVFQADVEVATGDRPRAEGALVRAREIVDNDLVMPFARNWLDEAETRFGRVAVRAADHKGSLLEELTDREMSILRMLPGTATQREIGAALFLSINTIKSYHRSLYRKLDVASRAEAVQAARALGLI